MLRPKQCFSEKDGVNVYYLAPFMIEQWHKGAHEILSKQYTVIAECYLCLVYEIEAADAAIVRFKRVYIQSNARGIPIGCLYDSKKVRIFRFLRREVVM